MTKPSGISTKTLGLLAAGLLTLIFILIIWVSVANTHTPTASNADLFPADPSEIPNIEETQTGGEMLVTMVDKNNPTRVAGTLKADRFEPIGQGRRRLDNPESWIYPQDGRAIKITADFATMLMPDPNQPPESGTLEGNILIEAFASKESLDSPILTARFDQPVEFERRYLRLRSSGHFQINSPQFDFSGANLTVILNELRNRVELIDVVQGDELVIHTNTKSKTPQRRAKHKESNEQWTMDNRKENEENKKNHPNPTPTASSNTPIQTNPQTNPQNIADTLTRYHITLNDQVVAQVVGSGSATADRLELWAALQGGTLPDDAIKPIALVPTPPPPPPQTNPIPVASSPADPKTTPTPQAQPATSIVITWSGKMSLRPIAAPPPSQLLDNALALRLTADEERGITFALPEQDFTGQAFAATYLATQGVLELESKQTQAGIIELKTPDTGTLIATSLVADLTKGIVTLTDRGQITALQGNPSDPESHATIQWKNNATFTLDMIDHALTDRLTHARFEGTVIAQQAGNYIGAGILDARFDPSRPSANALTKITLADGVLSSASKSLLTGTTLEIDFIPGSGNNPIDPIRLLATGQVLGRNHESILKTEHLVITLMRNPAGKTIVRTANAQGTIQYTGPDQTAAQGNTLQADTLNETMTLLGTPAKITQGGSSILGDHINLNAQRRSIEVLGPGSFDHDIALEGDNPNALATGHIRATWKGTMRFDDAIGSIVCEDQVKVVSTPDPYTRDTLTAHRAQIQLTPNPTTDPIAGTNSTSNTRELITARIYGYAPLGQDPVLAKIESRTYDQDQPERVIGLIYLEGPQILADNQNQTLTIPAPGTLLIMDRAVDNADDAAAQPTAAPPGLTRFTWQGRMNLDRAQGTARFTDQVLVRPKTISTGEIAQLNTNQLDARFEFGLQDQEQSTRLLGVDAIGSVRFRYQNRELIADSALYDAITDSLFASAIDHKLVTLYDENQPAPMSAKTMTWNLAKDRIEINTPTPIRAPGN